MKIPVITICLMAAAALPAAGAPAREDIRTASQDSVLAAERTGVSFGRGELREPLGLAVDDRGFILVADAMAGKVYRYSPRGESVEFEVPDLDAGFYPIDVAAHGTMIYVLDYAGNRALRYEFRGAWLDVLLEFDQFTRMRPVSLTSSSGGRLITTDMEHHDLTVWSPLLDVEMRTGEFGPGDGSFEKPTKASFFGNDRIAVAEFGNARVQVLNGSGRFEGYAEPAGGVEMVSPRYAAGGPDGYLFVADPGAGIVYGFTSDLRHVMTIGAEGGMTPSAVAASWDYRLYVADLETRSVLEYRLYYPGR